VEKGQVRLLLDTNALIWAFSDPKRLSEYAREKIRDEANDVLVSVVSVWEIGVKRAKQKLDMPGDLEAMISAKKFDPLPLALRHALAIEALPHQHHDPFDRMLIAQAQVDGLTLVTSDREMQHYPISVLSAF
jgi:PIN domain nuclease of toxin-antitoxin system